MDSGIKTLAWLDEDKSTQRFPQGTAGQILVSQGPNDKPIWRSKSELNLEGFLPLTGGVMGYINNTLGKGPVSFDITESKGRYYGVWQGAISTATLVIKTKIAPTNFTNLTDSFIQLLIKGVDQDKAYKTVDLAIGLHLVHNSGIDKTNNKSAWVSNGSVEVEKVGYYTQSEVCHPGQSEGYAFVIKLKLSGNYRFNIDVVCDEISTRDTAFVSKLTDITSTTYPNGILYGWGSDDSNSETITELNQIIYTATTHKHQPLTIGHYSDVDPENPVSTTDSYDGSEAKIIYQQSHGVGILLGQGNWQTISLTGTNNQVLAKVASTQEDPYGYKFVSLTTSLISDLSTTLENYSQTSHTHTKSQITDFAHDHNITDLLSGTNSATTKVLMGGNGSSEKPTWKSLSDAGIAPTSHVSSTNTYGVSTATLYGHAKSASSIPLVASGSGALGDQADVFARENHVHPAQTEVHTAYQLMYPTSFMVTGGATSEAVEFDGTQGYVQLKITQLNPYMLGPNALAAIGAAASNHTHSYAGSSSAGGAANSVKEKLKIQLNGGTTTEYNGSTERTINITASDVGAAVSDHSHGITSLKNGLTDITAGRILVSSDGIDGHPIWLTNGTEGQVLTQGQDGAGWATIRQRKYLKVNDASNNDIKSSGTGYTIAMSENTDLTLHIICGSNESSNYNRYITLPDISNLAEGDRLEIVITNTSSKVANINIDNAKNDASLYRTQNNNNITSSERHISSGEHLTADVVIISGTTKVWRMIKHSELNF